MPIMVVASAITSLVRPFMPSAANTGFQLVGPPSIAKSTLLFLAQSVTRSPTDPAGMPSSITLSQFLSDPLRRTDPFHDHFLPIDDVALERFAGSTAKQKQSVTAFADQLLTGRLSDDVTVAHRFAFALAGNSSLAEQRSSVATPANCRIPTIRIDPPREYGVSDKLPEGVGNSSDFADALKRGAAENFGHVRNRMIKRLLHENPATV